MAETDAVSVVVELKFNWRSDDPVEVGVVLEPAAGDNDDEVAEEGEVDADENEGQGNAVGLEVAPAEDVGATPEQAWAGIRSCPGAGLGGGAAESMVSPLATEDITAAAAENDAVRDRVWDKAAAVVALMAPVEANEEEELKAGFGGGAATRTGSPAAIASRHAAKERAVRCGSGPAAATACSSENEADCSNSTGAARLTGRTRIELILISTPVGAAHAAG